MKKVISQIIITISILAGAISPAFVYAQAPALDYSGFVKCDGVVNPAEPGRNVECNFGALIDTIVKAINWMFVISIPLATALFAYAGVLYMTGEKGKIETAKKIFASVATGFIIMLTAWFLVRQVITWIVKDPSATTFLGNKAK